MNYSWNWAVLIEQPYLGWLAQGLATTIAIACAAWVLALALGGLVGIASTVPGRALRLAAGLYVNLFRNVPLLLQLFIWFFVVPELLPEPIGRWLKRDLPMPELWTSIVALGLFTAARVAAQVRTGIGAVAAGQQAAALASGMSLAQAYRHVLLPQALRIVIPPLTSDFLTVFKNSALALTIGVAELTAQSRQIEAYTFQGFEAFTAATLLYLAIASVVTLAMRFVERRSAVPGLAGARA